MQTHLPNPTEVPEDVLAEMDVEERRAGVGSGTPTLAPLPEEVRSDLDHEARRADEAQRLELQEGRPPADDEDTPTA